MDTLFNSGDVLNSRYRILSQLGHGGFGRTYLAEDINRFNERCVLKEFAPQLQGSFALKKAQELFEREAGVLYRLRHPQIPKFRELFRYKHQGKGCLLLVQDYVEGQTYHTLYNNRFQQGIKFSEAEISQLLFQLLPVLEYIHSMGIIHRDISPDNLMLRNSDGLTVLIDFGSIKEAATKAQSELAEAAPKIETLSLIGTVLGKSGYAPPEQMKKGIVGAHNDLYALAATAMVLLTGKEPQELIDPCSLKWNWQEEVTLSPKLEWVLTKMLAPNPSERFASATEVIQALKDISAIPPRSQAGKQQPPTNKILISRYFQPTLLVSLAFIVATLLGASWWLKDQGKAIYPNITSNSNNSTQVESQLGERFSQGEKVLISQTTTPEKELAVDAFEKGNYYEAVSLFSASLKAFSNDPEALIYLNNARIGKGKYHTIAASIPIGSDVNAAQEILRGVAQAQNQINQAGGIQGIPLKVVIVNDDNNPEVAKEVAATLSQNSEILGVVGHYASDVTLATAKIYQSGQLVAISPISTSVKLSNFSPYIFRTVPSDYIAARALADYMLEEFMEQNVAVFYSSQSNYSQSLKSEFVTAVSLGGGQVVNEFDLSRTDFSAAQSLKQAMNEGAQVLMLAANTGTLDKALQVVQVNRQRLSLLGGDDVYTPKTLEIVGELAENMVLAIPWHILIDPDAEFAQVASRLWGGEVNWRTAMAYDATKALIAAIERSPTRIGVQQVLSNSNFVATGAGGKIRFFPSGDRHQAIQLVKIQPGDRTSFGYEFVPIVSPSQVRQD